MSIAHERRSALFGLGLFVAATGLLVVMGCAKPPEDAATRARAAIETAKAAEADVYAPEIYRAALDTLGMAEAEERTQLSKFAIGRRFGHAQELYEAAAGAAERAGAAAQAGRAEAAAEVQRLLVQVRQTDADLQALLGSDSGRQALRAPRTAQGLEVLSGERAQVARSLENIEEALARGQQSQALQMARVARDQMESIQGSITEAVTTGRMPSLGDK